MSKVKMLVDAGLLDEQELTDEHTKQIDELLKHKEAEVMEV